MSYNLNSVEYVEGTGPLVISRSKLEHYRDNMNESLAECNFIDEEQYGAVPGVPSLVSITKPWWSSEGSGRYFDVFIDILKSTHGAATLHLIWEGGDSQQILRVVDGAVTEHRPVISAGPIIKTY